MVLRIDIAPQTELLLRRQAETEGKDVGAYISQLVEQAAARASLDELLAPIRRESRLRNSWA